jgi:thioredoxin 1
MLDRRTGPLKYLVIAFILVLVYQYSTGERKIDAQGIAGKDKWFEQHVYQEPGPVLLKFGAEWCPPCRSLDANLRALESTIGSRVKIVRVDIDQHPELASTFGVRSIPHSFVLYQGRIVDERLGGMDQAALQKWVADASDKAYRTASR